MTQRCLQQKAHFVSSCKGEMEKLGSQEEHLSYNILTQFINGFTYDSNLKRYFWIGRSWSL